MENETVVNEESTLPAGSEPQEDVTPEETSPAPGSKTDSELLLKSLKEEREKRREMEQKQKELEEEINNIKASGSSDIWSEDDLESQVKALKSELDEIRANSAKLDILNTYPVIKDIWSEFEEFHSSSENKGMSLKTAAKAFVIEKDLLGNPRQGLEKPTSGPKNQKPLGTITSAEAQKLRETNYRKYKEMLMNDQIKIQD